MQAHALWLTAPRAVAFCEEEVPAPGPDQLLIQAIASGVSHGTERLVYRGEVAQDLPLDLPTLAGSFAFPIKYGYAMVGQVLAVGAQVMHTQPGDLIFALHPHQSCFVIAEQLTLRLPAGLTPELGVFAANVETALTILHDSPLRLGETVLVFGQGIVGLLLAQLLRMAGARRVLAVEPLALRRDLALAQGVDAVLMPSPQLAEQVRELNDGRLADVTFEVSGNPHALQAAIDTVMDEGTVVVASWYGTKPVTLALGERFHRGRLRLRASQVGHLPPEHGPRWDYARRSQAVAALLTQLDLAALITHRIPFAEAARAYQMIDTAPEQIGQIVITY